MKKRKRTWSDQLLLVGLTHCIELVGELALDKAGRLLPSRERRRQLVEEGLLIARPTLLQLIPAEQPLFVSSRDGKPNCGTLAWLAQKRGRELAIDWELVLAACPRTVGIFGGRCGSFERATYQRSHAVHLGAIWIKALLDAPQLAETIADGTFLDSSSEWSWHGEMILDGDDLQGDKMPDSLVRSPAGEWIVDSLGTSYDAQRITDLVELAEQNNLGYELW